MFLSARVRFSARVRVRIMHNLVMIKNLVMSRVWVIVLDRIRVRVTILAKIRFEYVMQSCEGKYFLSALETDVFYLYNKQQLWIISRHVQHMFHI